MEKRRSPPPAQSDWAYFLDFDGTLLDLAATPDAIHVDPALPELLTGLHRATSGAVALISGRALSDLDFRLELPDLPKAGQHGMERRDAVGRLWLHAVPPEAKQAIQVALLPILAAHPELLLEDKGLTLALHYRQAPQLAAWLEQLVRRLVMEVGDGLFVQSGKFIVEVRAAGVDKGKAVAEYLAELPFLGRRPVFIGDDRSDEHGFAAVRECDGLAIAVGPGSFGAQYRLDNVAAVRAWLSTLLSDQP